MFVGVILVSIQIKLAHGAQCDHDVGLVLVGRIQQAANEFIGDGGADLSHVAAAAMGFHREIYHFRAQRFHQFIQDDGIFGAAKAVFRVGAHHHAAVVGGDAQAG